MERDHWMEHDVEKDTSDRVSVHLDCPSLDVCFLSLPRFDGWYGFILMVPQDERQSPTLPEMGVCFAGQ